MDPVVISAVSAGVSGLSAAIAISSIIVARLTARQLKASDADLDRRKFVATLWDRMAQIRSIDPADPDEGDVQNALNSLELVAVCWENNLVDKPMILVVFGDVFVLRTREIAKVPRLALIQRTGDDLLQKDYPLVLKVESEIQARLTERKTRR